MSATIVDKIKANLIVDDNDDDALIAQYAGAAIAYAEGYQHKGAGYYGTHEMTAVTEEAVIMLASHFYESRDGGTGGFFHNSAAAAERSMLTIDRLLSMDKDWSV